MASARQSADVDVEAFRIRRFVDRLIELGECDVHDGPLAMIDVSREVESNGRAKLFRNVGPQRFQMTSGIGGNRRRLAAAFGCSPHDLAQTFAKRQANPQPTVEIPSSEAPVHAVVVQGGDIDLTKLPFHLQHERDGGPYISSALDYSVDPATGRRNVGARRLMMRSRTTMYANLTALSDLKSMYLAAVARKEALPVSFVIGAHPIDFTAGGLRPQTDEVARIATLRGAPMAVVRSLTNEIRVPADAEAVIEGYFDHKGHRELEGPYGEFMGYYGPVKIDPVFHVTAITTRRDVLWHTVLHGGSRLAHTEHGTATALVAEVRAWAALRAVGLEPHMVAGVPASNGRQHMRVSLPRTVPGQARLAISALFALPFVKHVFVVDADIDVLADDQIEWAMATRFSADRDLVVQDGFPSQSMDILAGKDKLMTKAGFDMTLPFDLPKTIVSEVPYPPRLDRRPPRYQTVRQALERGPTYFLELMELLGSEDGREIALELHTLRKEGVLSRTEPNGQWVLKGHETARGD